MVVEYTYDAWGKILRTTGSLASTVGVMNPYRYRGYSYDDETGFYYLQSRYYNAECGRFLNADDIIVNNLFVYCNNNPVKYADPSGHWIIVIFGIAIAAEALVSMILATAVVLVTTYFLAQNKDRIWRGLNYMATSFADGMSRIYNGINNYFTQDMAFRLAPASLHNINLRYDIGQCKQAADAMKRLLRRLGKHGKFIGFQYSGLGKHNNVWSDSLGKVIATNGFHCGILYNGLVFCNVHPWGLPEGCWRRDFHGLGVKTPIEYYF